MSEHDTSAAPRLTFVLGGARSGKSVFAEGMIERMPPPWVYLATAGQVQDEEMRRRIAVHRQRRGTQWQVVEAPRDLAEALTLLPQGAPVLIDCLTLWLSNVMLAQGDLVTLDQGAGSGHDLERGFDDLISVLSRPRGFWVVVSNEVGQGIVPNNALARRFRDDMGRLNARVAAIADQVHFVTAGLPVQLK